MPSREAIAYLRQKYEVKSAQLFRGINKDKAADVCVDCNEVGHKHKGNYQCKHYKAPKKRKKATEKDDMQTKVDKQQGKQRRLSDNRNQRLLSAGNSEADVKCSSCGEADHNSARSKQCRNYKLTLDETLEKHLGTSYERFTRKLYLDSVIKKEYKDEFKRKVIILSNFIRNVIFRAQLSVNLYIADNKESYSLTEITQQNFWYSICQQVLDQPVTNKQYVSNNMVLAFADLRETIPNIVYSLKDHKITGYSDALSATCKTTATAYLNNIVEHFQQRTLYYLKVKLKAIYKESPQAGYIKKISEDYCWEYLIEGSPIWLDSFDMVDVVDTRVRVVGICIALKEKLTLIPTVLNLASSPSKFIPALGYMLADIEDIRSSWADAEKKMPNMFALSPQPSLRWRHVTINNKSLQSLIRVKAGSDYEGNVKQFSTVFDFRKLKYKSVEELLDANNKFGLFCCNIQTDGHGICFIFGRKKVEQPVNTDILVLEDFDKEEVEKYFLPIAVDPGRRHVFTATIGHPEDEQEIRRCSAKERQCYAGTRRRALYLEKLKERRGIKLLETNIPTSKSASSNKLLENAKYMLNNLNAFFEFYSVKSATFNFHDYQGRQRSNAEMANVMLNGGKKYNQAKRKNTRKNRKERKKKKKDKPKTVQQKKKKNQRWPKTKFKTSVSVPLVVFGDGMKNKDTTPIRKNLTGTTSVLHKELKKRSRLFTSAVMDINEYNTSKVCNKCKSKSLGSIVLSGGKHSYGILKCKNCSILWNRDINASKNMLDISLSIWNGQGRPPAFTKEIAVLNTVQPEMTV